MASRRTLLIGAAVAAVVVGGVVARSRVGRRSGPPEPAVRRTFTTPTGMDVVVLGDGPRTMLVIPGGPGSEISDGGIGRMMEKGLWPYVEAGWTVWMATRPRHMPPGHTVADMAADHARLIDDEMGHADVVLGQSFGGMIAFHLGADHPGVADRFVVVGAAATLSDWAKSLDRRLLAADRAGHPHEADAVLVELLVDLPDLPGVRALAGRAMGAMLARGRTPRSDLLVEVAAEVAYDARETLARIATPVLLLGGGADRYFPVEALTATVQGIPGADHRIYPGVGHVQLFGDPRVPRDVLDWLAGSAD
ncbi:alpha/beta fold hydrolase [Georgenia sp. Z1491]|uniref:alpha/beta fold hydrolase n=1 Tax=Georgenia sp. Z1491 TaxID=3416707 RepID=UPI003CF2F7A7